MHGQPRIADASQLEFRVVHRTEWTGLLDGSTLAPYIGGQTATALTDR
jgi:hypothetical protein